MNAAGPVWRTAGWTLRHPRWVLAGRAVLAAVLLFLVTFEGVTLGRQPTWPHAVVWVAGMIVVFLCTVPYPRVPLHVRGGIAAAVSWTATAVLIVIGHPLVVWGMGESIALLVLLSGVLRHSPMRTVSVLGPLLGLAAVIAPVRDADPGQFTLFFAVLAVVVSVYSLLLRAQAEQRMSDLVAVRTAERLELARELHDVIAHHVTGIAVQAQAAAFAELQGPAAGEAFRRIDREAGEALTAMRRLVAVMREKGYDPAATAPVAGLADVRALVESFERTGPPVLLTIERGLEDALPVDTAAGAHRIVREALTNVRKHAADATAVRVTLSTRDGRLEVRVTDDGRGTGRAAPARRGGFGLVGMGERAAALGGRLEAGPVPEGGWQVAATLPLERND
ncbi:two-component sensor histidine kinase [Streptomyces sp. A7024]|uniref:histidine kinase n=1 Tax=Streptomyces coryli TaxID=1128680 RepID=A0A6G4UA41_9ACTN|nr:histidine kinase [Streptomyces coryli]NGN68872.1 two-component sensor histidine kinase [Streptomyces coryli]